MNAAGKKIEALLFSAGRPFKRSQLLKMLELDGDGLEEALKEIAVHLNDGGSGIKLFESESEVALVTDPEVSEFVRDYLKKDITGELTKPSVETLSIIAYRGPITKPEIEQIRGVNCSLILRNLQIRGLIDETDHREGARYTVSVKFLRHLGVESASALPSFEELNKDATINSLSAEVQ